MMMMCVFRMTDSPHPIPQEGKEHLLVYFNDTIVLKRKNFSDSTRDNNTREDLFISWNVVTVQPLPIQNHSKTSNNQSPLQKGYKLQSLTSRVGYKQTSYQATRR